MIEIPNGTFIGDDSRSGVFVLTFNGYLPREAAERVREQWRGAWESPGDSAPKLMILEGGATLRYAGPPGNDGLVPGAEFCAA